MIKLTNALRGKISFKACPGSGAPGAKNGEGGHGKTPLKIDLSDYGCLLRRKDSLREASKSRVEKENSFERLYVSGSVKFQTIFKLGGNFPTLRYSCKDWLRNTHHRCAYFFIIPFFNS